MATDDGTPTRDEATPPEGPDPLSGRAGHGAEPTELPSDWPGPVSWGASLGAGGEVIADPTELVPLTDRGGDRPSGKPVGTGARRRRAPRRARADGAGGDSRRRRASMGMPNLNTLVAAGGAVGLAGLAGLLVVVLFFGGGIPAPAPDDRGDGVAAVAQVTTDQPRTAAPPTAPRASMNDKMGKRRAADRTARRARQRDRTRERQAPAAPAAATPVAATPPPAPSPTPAPAPAPSVSPAEREFTPGPWNLS
ncbi:MAG: hypothetical protein AB7I38_16280 [Dehalococcoidia bacterium]